MATSNSISGVAEGRNSGTGDGHGAMAGTVDSKASSNHVEASHDHSDKANYGEKKGLTAYDDGLDHEHEPPVSHTLRRKSYRPI